MGNYKITHIIYSGMGGTGTYLKKLLSSGFSKHSNNHIIFYGLPDLDKDYKGFCDKNNFSYSFIQKKKGIDLKSFRDIVEGLKQSKPDYIFLHSINAIIPVWLYKRGKKVKVIGIEHTSKEVKRPTDRINSILSMVISERTITFFKGHARSLKRELGVFYNEKKCVIIPKGIDINYFHPLKKKVKKEEPLIIGMAGRLSESRDHLTLLKAFKKLLKEHPDSAELRLAGNGKLHKTLRKYCEENGFLDKVVFKGKLDVEKLKTFYGELDLYIHASHGETGSYAIMEAMAMGIPVILAKAPGIEDAIVDNKKVLFYLPSDDTDLLSKVKLFLNGSESLSALGKVSRDIAEKEFSSEEMSAYYLNLLNQFTE